MTERDDLEKRLISQTEDDHVRWARHASLPDLFMLTTAGITVSVSRTGDDSTSVHVHDVDTGADVSWQTSVGLHDVVRAQFERAKAQLVPRLSREIMEMNGTTP